jgi:hypothetical protein
MADRRRTQQKRENRDEIQTDHGIHTRIVPPAWVLKAPGDPSGSLPRRIAAAELRRLVRHGALTVRHRRPRFHQSPSSAGSTKARSRIGRSPRHCPSLARRSGPPPESPEILSMNPNFILHFPLSRFQPARPLSNRS